MTKQPHPHRERRDSISFVLMILIVAISTITIYTSCNPKGGYRATKGMNGYSKIRCLNTDSVCVFNEKGELITIYKETSK